MPAAALSADEPARSRVLKVEWHDGMWEVRHVVLGRVTRGASPCDAVSAARAFIESALSILSSYGTRTFPAAVKTFVDDLEVAHLDAHIAEAALEDAKRRNIMA